MFHFHSKTSVEIGPILRNFTLFAAILVCVQSFSSHMRGPSFVMEPPILLEFSNSSGGWLDCSASGNPAPTIDWLSADGTSVGDVAGIRRVYRNGTLFLMPFIAAAYRQDIHNSIYRCVASNSVGRIISRDVQLRAVVAQSFDVKIEVLTAARGCTAVLKCVIPAFVKDLVRITSWIQEPAFFIYPSLQGDGKFHQLPTGELLIHSLEFSDQFPTYRCRTMHRLSRQVIISSAANVRIAEHRGIVSPVIVESSSNTIVTQDEGAALICIAQGCPVPEYRWFSFSDMEAKSLSTGPRLRQLGPVLAIEAVTLEDSGVFKCSASNAGGEVSVNMRLVVQTPLQVEISPTILNIHMGLSAEFKCAVTVPSNIPYLITWYKDGRQIPMTSRTSGETLVISNVGREDKGMYQCIARRSEGDTAQAAAELQLGDAPPVLIYSFIEQTLQPGPSVSLKCSASGNPTPQIVWSLDGFPLPSHGRFVIGQFATIHGDVISHVNISHVMVEDGGEYSCTAANRAGKTSHSARLNVYGMPYIRLIPKITAVAGEVLELKCPVAGYPIEEIHWERGGRELPDDLRQKVLRNGTLIITAVEKRTDSGVYTCWARNKQGHSARRSGEVAVIVPPKISPFYVEDSLHVGDRTSLTCSVTKGDQPLTISWHKDGHSIDPTHMVSITQVDQFTSILVIEKLSSDHNGNYSCVVRNLAAEISHMHQLVVNVPPIIEPFSFQDGLSEGMRTRTVCGVSSGDPPVMVSWLKDGQPLTPSLGVNVSTLDPYSSLLSISSLDSRHSGDFTCVASNSAAEVRYTAVLQVKVPPRWDIEPVDISVQRDHQISVHCQAKGVPTPTVTWKRAKAGKSGDYENIKDHVYTRLLGNGTLILQHVKEDREGYYLCQAENGIGSGIGKVIYIRVNSPPYFGSPSRLITARKSDIAVLRCDVNGDKPLNVIWLRGSNTELNPSANFRVQIKQDVTPEGVISEMQIINAQTSDTGSYFCQASNLYGKEQQLVQLLVQEPPSNPKSLETDIITSTSVSLKWKLGADVVEDIIKFILEYKEIDKSWDQAMVRDSTSATIVIDDLKPATKYTFRVIAEGSAGKSAPSAELIIETKPQRPGGAPINVSIRPVSSTAFILTWSPPIPELRYGYIEGFNIGYQTGDMRSYNFTTVMNDGEDNYEFILKDLKKFARYVIVVQAFNKVGPGPLSEPATSQTLEDVPSMPPEDIRCAALTSQSVQISWQPPNTEHCNGLLQGYKLTYEPIIEDNWMGVDEVEVRKTSALTTVITGLKKFTNYSIQLLAFTKIGEGAIASPILCQTEEDVPGHPADVKVAVSSPQSLKLSWLFPNEPNGLILKFNIYKRSMDGNQEVDHTKQTVSSQHTSYEVKNVQSHIEYQFWVTASTRIGEGPSSKVVSQIVTPRVPARIISFGGILIRPWRSSTTLPCESVGTQRIEWFLNEGRILPNINPHKQILSTGDLIIPNLQVSDMGNLSCIVENEQGSDKIIYFLYVQVPPSAPLLFVTSATTTSMLLHWKIENNGRARINGLTLNYRKEHGILEEMFLSKHLNGFELKNLDCGSTYYLYLTAYNKIGSSPGSQVLRARTQGHPPGVPPASHLLLPNTTSVLLRLHVWPDNGCPLLYFIVQYRKSSETQWTLVSNSLRPQRQILVTGLVSATKYVLKMEVYNVAGYATEEYSFLTLSTNGDKPFSHIKKQTSGEFPFYIELKLLLILFGLLLGVLLSFSGIIVYFKKRNRNEMGKEQIENQQNVETQKERYYATIHKGAFQAGDKIPETSEDISPYATFQLSETLPQNTMLHSFMYHEHPMTEGCASTPPVMSTIRGKAACYDRQEMTSGDERRQKHYTKKAANIYAEDSESESEQISVCKTRSSNHLDKKYKHSKQFLFTPSSTSSDISLMSDQKSIPRKPRAKWLTHNRSASQKHTFSHLSVVETSFSENLSAGDDETLQKRDTTEADCDIERFQNPKLGLKTVWSKKPEDLEHPLDYSIAV